MFQIPEGREEMSPVDPITKDLSVLQIDPSRKGRLEPEKTGSTRTILLVVVAIAVAIVAVGWAVHKTFANVPLVQVARVETASGPRAGAVVLTAGGYIVAHHTIDVSSKIVGKVAWIGVEKGDKVKQGEVLVQLDDADYRAQVEQAKANLAASQANLKKLEAGSRPQEIQAALANVEQAQADFQNNALNLKRTRELYQQKIDSQQQLDAAVDQYKVSKGKLDNAQQNYDLAKIGNRIEDINYARAQVEQNKAALDYAQTQLDATLIRSPIDGTVLDRNVEKGELVSNMNFGGTGGVKTSVVTLANLKDLQVELDINENDFPRLRMHQKCNVTADAYPSRIYQGELVEEAPEADRQKATIQVKVQVLHPDSYLRPEMNAHVSFLAPATVSKTSAETLTIPRQALTQDQGKPAVFLLDGNHVQLHAIEIGRDLGQRVEVLDGLGPNDRVVVSSFDGLSSGARVKVSSGA
jgi:HlyD family secretion protein